MKRLIAIVLLLLLINAESEAAFSFYRSVTVDHTKVPNTDQSSFPVGVIGTYSYLATVANGGKAQNASGFDVGFYTSNDCATGKMNWETEKYTATDGTVVYWVNNATLSHTSDTVFYMCYGDATISTDQSNKTGVWDSNFKAVYHLPDGSSLNLNDSTSNANHLTNNSLTATTGQLDGGAAASGSSQYATLATSPVSTFYPLTFSAWVNSSVTAGVQTVAIVQKGTVNNNDMFRMILYQSKVQFQDQSAGGILLATTANYPTTGWFYITGTASSARAMTVYLNAANTTSGTGTATVNVPDNLSIGREASLGEYLSGSIDEVRVSNIDRSADWITTEYNNQSSPSTFYTVGTEVGGSAATSHTMTLMGI